MRRVLLGAGYRCLGFLPLSMMLSTEGRLRSNAILLANANTPTP